MAYGGSGLIIRGMAYGGSGLIIREMAYGGSGLIIRGMAYGGSGLIIRVGLLYSMKRNADWTLYHGYYLVVYIFLSWHIPF